MKTTEIFAVCGILLVSLPMAVTAKPGVPIVNAGEPAAVIVLAEKAEPDERLAAEELRNHVELISGAVLPIVSESEAVPKGQIPIRIGQAAPEALQATLTKQSKNISSFLLAVTPQEINIRGVGSEGTLFGVYELLEQMGVRWYYPGEEGRVLPRSKDLAVREQETLQVPSFDFRVLQNVASSGPWSRRARLGGNARSTGAHGIPPFMGKMKAELFEAHPEYRGLVDGERKGRQICVGNPEVLALAVEATREIIRKQLAEDPTNVYVGMGPDDGVGYCECPKCLALDQGVFDPLVGSTSMTDRYIWFFNQILEQLEDEFPNLHLVWYIYASHMMPPKIEPNPRIVGVFAPISLDRIRGMDNPMSPDRYILRWLIDSWSATKPNEMYYRGYYNNLACPQFPFSQVDRIRSETPVYREKGINVMRVEVIAASWSVCTPSLYLATRMMWNSDTDVDALLNEFYELFYGPASGPMKEYHETLDKAFTDSSSFAGGAYPYLTIFNQALREKFRSILERAEATIHSDKDPRPEYAVRVSRVRDAWDRLELFLDVIAARNQCDFQAAHAKMEEFYDLSEKMGDVLLESDEAKPTAQARMLNVNQADRDGRGNYFNRFWASPIKAGFHRTVEAGELVHAFPDEWLFLIDPAEIGEISGYHRPGQIGGGWQPFKTFSKTWSDQGLHYYKGKAWYRNEFSVDPKFKDRPLYLWFAGVDELAKVWVNGEFLGTNREPLDGLPGVPGTFRPFDLNATKAIHFDRTNTVVVEVQNENLDELGTGGLVGPVMLWTPRDPNWKPVAP